MQPEHHWNYRVVLQNGSIDIHSVHYSNGKPHSMSESPQTIGAGVEEGVESLKWQLDMMRKALDKPVLEYKEGEGFKEIPAPPKLCCVCGKRPAVAPDDHCSADACIPF